LSADKLSHKPQSKLLQTDLGETVRPFIDLRSII